MSTTGAVSVTPDPAPGPHGALPADLARTTTLSGDVAGLCSEVLGVPVHLATPPEPMDNTYGPGAYRFRPDFDRNVEVDPAWRYDLQVRVGDPTVVGERRAEAAALRLCREHGVAAPRLLADGSASVGGRSPLLVSTIPSGTGLLELLATEPHNANPLLQSMGTAHLALHAVPLDGSAETPVLPVVSVAAAFASVDVATGDLAWLLDHEPDTADRLVLCHGDYQPLVLSGDPTRGETTTIGNFSLACRSEREYDVAFAMLAFWVSPYFTTTRSEKAGMKMIRDSVARIYLGAYEAAAPLDADRLRYWQAFHALLGATKAEGPDRNPAFERADGILPPELPAALRKRFAQLTK